MVTTDKVTVAEFSPHIGKTTTDYKENDMGVKEIINRLYAYKDESNDERLNDLIDDVIKLIIDKCKPNTGRKVYEMPNGKTTIFEFDENGIGKITLEAMDRIVELLKEKDGFKCEEKENGECPFYAPSCGL